MNMNSQMKKDPEWFHDFASEWNGVSFFTNPIPVREIVADACLTGIGAATENSAYTYNVAYPNDPIKNVSEVEAVNVAVAIQTFLGPADTSTCVKV